MRLMGAALVLFVTVMSVALGAGASVSAAPMQSDATQAGPGSIEFTVTPRGEPTVGDLMTWDYEIVNNTSFRLEDVVVTDELEGQICFVKIIAASASRSCSVVTVAGPTSYESATKVRATSVTIDGEFVRLVEAELVRNYQVRDAGTAPADLAFAEGTEVEDSSPAWPIDRWAPWAVIGVFAAGIAVAAFRLQPEPEQARNSR